MTKTSNIAGQAEELSLLIEAVEDYAIFLLSRTGVIRSWNNGATRIMGYSADEALGSHFSLFYPPEDQAAGKPEMELVTARRDGRVEDEGWRVRKDGARFWANTIITVLRQPDGEVRGFAKITRDLTARQSAEQQLRRSEEMFRLLVDSVQDYAIFMLDPEGRVATWNLGAQRIKGYAPEEIMGRHFSLFYPEEQRHLAVNELEIASREGRFEDEGWRLRKDGSRFWASVVLTAIRDDRGNLLGFAKVTRDATERKLAEETRQSLFEQQQARFRAEQQRRAAESSYLAAQMANRAKDAFLMTLSHELRTPMTSILGWAALLPTLPVDHPSFREGVESIARNAALQTQLIDDVLDVSRIMSGKLHLKIENVDVPSILRSAVESVRPAAAARGNEIVVDLDDDLGPARLDSTRLQQVVWNLLSNAVKFTPSGGRIELLGTIDGNLLRITVRDTGEGIDPEFLPYIFEPFRQAENPGTRVHGGLGLGLSIVRYIAEAHGGSVRAESAGRGRGSTFEVSIPVDGAASAGKAAERRERASAPRLLSSCDLLVVDDEEDGRELIRTVLTEAGATVRTAGSVASAIDRILERKPDLIVTDIAMPGVDGFSLIEHLGEADHVRIPIVALSAFPRPKDARGSERLAAWVAKPIDPFAFVDLVADVLHRGERED
ncbi:MAG TPA: PAS domain S-box protein [Thermoanaerobaculia bacterium]|nr:PAS domain S-box protein [Thermoanaerobaculia bacterium]